MKISSSSRWSSSSVLGFDSSSGDCCGSHEATSRWLRDRATLARLRITSDSLLESDILVPLCSMSSYWRIRVGLCGWDLRCLFFCRYGGGSKRRCIKINKWESGYE